MRRRSNATDNFGNDAEILSNARLGDPFRHILDDVLRLRIYVGAGPVD